MKNMDVENFAKGLEKDLKQKFGEHIRFWVWPRYNCVNGFYGNGVINNAIVIWINERPSSARDKRKEHKFPDWVDKIFYRLLREEGLENMHLTDFVKIMEDAGKLPTEEELKISAEWMKKEIDLLKVNGKKLVIVANSKNVKKWMEKYIPEYNCIYYEFFKRTLRYRKKEIREELLRERLRELIKYTF